MIHVILMIRFVRIYPDELHLILIPCSYLIISQLVKFSITVHVILDYIYTTALNILN